MKKIKLLLFIIIACCFSCQKEYMEGTLSTSGFQNIDEVFIYTTGNELHYIQHERGGNINISLNIGNYVAKFVSKYGDHISEGFQIKPNKTTKIINSNDGIKVEY